MAWRAAALAAGALLAGAAHAVPDAGPSDAIPRALLERAAEAVVVLRVEALADAPSSAELGARRRGSGVLIDAAGHVLTNVFLVVDARRIEIVTQHGRAADALVVAQDHATGLAVLRAARSLQVEPMRLGTSRSVRERDRVFAIAGSARAQLVIASRVVRKHDYSTGREYWIDEAILTAPGLVQWNGAALVNRGGELVGVGHLLGFDRKGRDRASVRTVFVPVDLIAPVLPALIGNGARAGPERPWLGLILADAFERIVVTGVLPRSPAARAGLKAGDVILRVDDEPVRTHRELYRALWDAGPAGAHISLEVMREQRTHTLRVESIGVGAYYD